MKCRACRTKPASVETYRNSLGVSRPVSKYQASNPRLTCTFRSDVTAEYYINDAGSRTKVLVNSVYSSLHGLPMPEGGYASQYIADLGHDIARRNVATVVLTRTLTDFRPCPEALGRPSILTSGLCTGS